MNVRLSVILIATPLFGCATVPAPLHDVTAAALGDARRRFPSVEWDSRDTVAADLDCDGVPDAALVGDDGVAYRAAFALRRGSGFEWHQQIFGADAECAFPEAIDAYPLEEDDIAWIRESLPEFRLKSGCAVVQLQGCSYLWYFGSGMRKTRDPRIIECIHG